MGLKFLDFSLEDIKIYLKKPDVNIVAVLTFQKQLLTRKINSYKSINKKIDFKVEHYKETKIDRVTDIFSLYEMINHNEVLKKYFPEESHEIYMDADAHVTHDELDKALILLASKNIQSISTDDKMFIIEAFRKFISDYFCEVTKETIEKTAKVTAEISLMRSDLIRVLII